MDASDRTNMEENLNKVDNSSTPRQQEPQSNMKVAIYARVSTLDQSINTQLLLLREYCTRMDYKEVEEYQDEGFSGKDDKRPAFERMLRDLRENKINCIIVYKLDRIGRSLQHIIALFEEFKRRNVEFISLTQNINTTTPEGKMFWLILCVFGQYERELIISRTVAGLARARKEGKILGRPKGRKDKNPRRTSGYTERWKEWRERQKLSTNSS